jgi:ERCC4-related helicase
MSNQAKTFAPGARVLIRDEEWLIKNTLPVLTGGTAVRVVGLSELVRNYEAVFLSELDEIEELKPENTSLVSDVSPYYRRSSLYLESLLRRTPQTDNKIYFGHNAAIDYAPFQLTPTKIALEALRPRVLIADGVGLGKTIEVGILVSELIKRGRGDRILAIANRSMLTQFQEELWARFSIPLVRLDSVGIRRVRSKIPSNKNPFYYYDRAIISIDTLKNDAQYRHYLEQSHWDIIVIDECHNVANTGSQRNRLASLLARTCDSLILTSATPHNGRPESFANLMNMLEPTAIVDESDYSKEEISGLFVRRFKKDIEDQVEGKFSDREVEIVQLEASQKEERFFNTLSTTSLHTLSNRKGYDHLYRIGLLKGFLSSPIACINTIDGRLGRINKRLEILNGVEAEVDEANLVEDILETDDDQLSLFEDDEKSKIIENLETDQGTLLNLRNLADDIQIEGFSKYSRLLKLLKELGVNCNKVSPRIIIFSERIATLNFLFENLSEKYGVDSEVVKVFHAGLPDVEQTGIVESFGKEDSLIRILLASDVASEGVNLHYFCNLMIHFDIPWSLITLEQRNGRIDRYGQNKPPLISYLLTNSKNEIIEGDKRILNRLIEKEQEAHKNIGDVATLLGLHEAQQEEKYIIDKIVAGESPEEIIPDEPKEVDWLAMLTDGSSISNDEDYRGQTPHIYVDDLEFAKIALEELADGDALFQMPEFHPERPEFSFLAPEDLQRRCEFIPREAIPGDWIFKLTTDTKRVMKAIDEARKEEKEWPKWQLLWELHPVMEWLMDKLLVRFGRHEAPVIISPKLDANELIYLFQGILSNQRSQPVITDWFGMRLSSAGKFSQIKFEEVLQVTGLKSRVPNSGVESASMKIATDNLKKSVELAIEYLKTRRKERGQTEGDRLRNDLRKLKVWKESSLSKNRARLDSSRGAQTAKLKQAQKEVEALYVQREKWLNDTYSVVNAPYVRLAMVFTGK